MSKSRGRIAAIVGAVDPGLLSPSEGKVIAQNHVGEIEIALSQPIAADVYAANPRTGRLVLDLAGRISGGGLILSVAEEERGSAAADNPAPQPTVPAVSLFSDGERARAGKLAQRASRLELCWPVYRRRSAWRGFAARPTEGSCSQPASVWRIRSFSI